MDEEANFLTMMPAVACYAKGKDDGAGREVEYLSTVELYNTGGIFSMLVLGGRGG